MFKSEERQMIERIKNFMKKEKPPNYAYIMLSDGRILDIDNYRKMVDSGKITPQDAYVHIRAYNTSSNPIFRYPFLALYDEIPNAYLSKLGFNYLFFTAPATGLKYVAFAVRYLGFYGDYLSIEVTSLDNITNNTNLSKIVVEVLGKKLISGERELTGEEYWKIYDMFRSQRLFAGYNVGEAKDIIYEYYNRYNQSLTKEVARISIDYDRIFHPYRVCYNMKTWKEIDCSSINLD